MTENNSAAQTTSTVSSDKENNFRLQERALRDQYERQLSQERAERERLQRELEAKKAPAQGDDEEDDSEPYVDRKKLNKTLNKFGQKTMETTQTEIQRAIKEATYEAKKEAWLENNQDFVEVLQHADKLAEKSPMLAKTILNMPDNFERQKLVYANIKELGLHKPPVKELSIQEQIDAKKRGQYYQPTNMGTSPYQGIASDFSADGKKAAYEKMQEKLKGFRL